MGQRKFQSKKKRSNAPPFVFMNGKTLWSEVWLQLPFSRQVIYLSLKARYNGQNNGRIYFPYLEFKDQFKAKKTFYDALIDLEALGWISRFRIGGKYRFYYLYELTGRYDEILKPRKPFVGLDRNIFVHPRWRNLSCTAKSHYLLFKCSKKGWTDEVLTLPYSKTRALCAPGTSKKARDELIAGEWIEEVGVECGMFGKAKGYKLTRYWDHWPEKASVVYGKYIQGAKN